MTSIVISCSLTPDEKAFLEDWQLSATQLLKEKIWEMKGIWIKVGQDRIVKLQRVISKQADEIESLKNS